MRLERETAGVRCAAQATGQKAVRATFVLMLPAAIGLPFLSSSLILKPPAFEGRQEHCHEYYYAMMVACLLLCHAESSDTAKTS